jgi:hypothetical protein
MGAVNVEVSLDELRKFVPKFVNATTLEIGKELLRQARLLVRDDADGGLLAVTPPQGMQEGRDKGEWAVARDIKKVFALQTAIASIVVKNGERGLKTAFNRAIREGRYEDAKQIVNNQKSGTVNVKGYQAKRHGKVVSIRPYTQRKQVSALGDNRLGFIDSISNTPDKEVHQRRRIKSGSDAGSIRKPRWSQIVIKKTSLNSYIADRQKRVGMLKAGWAVAAAQANLGVSIPNFIRRNMAKASGSGRTSFSNPTNMYVELVNTIPVASSKINKGNINFLVGLRQAKIKAEMENRLRAVERKVAA